MKDADKAVLTTTVGCLAAFEKRLGHTWGLGKPEEELSEVEKAMAEIANEIRKDFFNVGNKQRRLLSKGD